MSKLRKLLIVLLSLISTLCLTLVGCGEEKIEFVDFENKTVNFDLGELFDASEYMDVYDVNGNMYLANVKITDVDGEPVQHLKYQFKVLDSYYKLTITIKDGDAILGTREIIVNGVDNQPPYITLLEMPSFGVYNQEVFIPIDFNDAGGSFNKKLVVEYYETNKINGEYITTLDSANPIVKTTSDFTDSGVAFVPTKPGNYRLTVYAWDEGKPETEARLVSKDYVIKETADAWGEVEGFDKPTSLSSNFYYHSTSFEYNPLRAYGTLVYVKNDAGDYLDADGNILYKRIDESDTENRIAFYKKADAQATDYDVLAYYQDLTNYEFYNAEGEIARTKEGCVTVKNADGTDFKHSGKTVAVGQEWYQEYTDNNGVTKYGVIKGQASTNQYSDTSTRFFFKSNKGVDFMRLYNGNNNTGWVENPRFDYISIWVLIKPKEGVTTDKTHVTVYADANVSTTKVPVGEWYEFKISKAEARGVGYYPYYYFSTREMNIGSYFNFSLTDYYLFDFYFDNISYAKGADIKVSEGPLLMGQEFSIDVENCGELTKDDFIFYVGQADSMLSTKSYNNVFNKDHVKLDGFTYTPALESGLTSRRYFIQAMLSADGLAKNGGNQVIASTIVTVSNVSVSLNAQELGQEVTITASLDGVDGVSYAYFYKESSATEWTSLADNKFTPSKPTSYDVKVVASMGDVSVEKTITKDYTKEIALEIIPAYGDSKLLINKDITINATLPGSNTITVEIFDSENNPVTVTNGIINVPNMGVYTVKANTLYNGVPIYAEMDIRVSGPAQVTAEMPSTAIIGVNESLEIVAFTESKYTLKYSAKLPTGTIIALNSHVLPINFVGQYEVYVTAYENDVPMGEEILPLTVSAMTYANIEATGVYATFGYAGSEIGAWRVTEQDKATNKGLNTPDSIARGTLADGTVWNAEWHESITDIQGVTKYGVISTRPQITNASSSVANGIYLRSDVYSTTDVYKPFFGTLPYTESNDLQINSIIYDGYDYLSVPIYIEKADAQPGETHTVRLIFAVASYQVPYNTWYELKIDKFHLAGNISSHRPPALFSYRSAAGTTPLFYLSAQTDSADKLAADKDLKVYIDGIRTAKYDDQDFTSAKLVYTDETGTTTGAEVGRTPEMVATRISGNNAYPAAPIYIKPEFYVGTKLIPLEDIKVELSTMFQLDFTSSIFKNDKILKINSFSLNKGAVRNGSYAITAKLSYTDPDTNVVYRTYIKFLPMLELDIA